MFRKNYHHDNLFQETDGLLYGIFNLKKRIKHFMNDFIKCKILLVFYNIVPAVTFDIDNDSINKKKQSLVKLKKFEFKN